jgi:acyl-CoA reductase-like NAD-dependent aldehyde dehydrogenase
MKHYPLIIDGRDVLSDERRPVINPATGERLATYSVTTRPYLDEAVAAAESAVRTWRRDESARRRALRACAELTFAEAQKIATTLTQEQGKPLEQSLIEVNGAGYWLNYLADMALEPATLFDDQTKQVTLLRKPHGVVAAITPSNFPIILLVWKLAPALLAGNAVIAKPSPFTPLSTLLFAEALQRALPRGIFSVLAGGNEIGTELAEHPGVRKVAFTGSIEGGKDLVRRSAADLKRLTLELGGNDPAIVLDDADPNRIVDKLFWGAFHNAGQMCVSIKRLYLPEQLHDRVVAGLVELAKTVPVGDGLDPATKVGPLTREDDVLRIDTLVQDARAAGARVVAGGVRLERPGNFYPPTIVTEARAGMRLVDEEQFGTALPVIRYKTLDEALDQANQGHYGLGASVWTSDPARGASVGQEIESGMVWINQAQDFIPYAPFGGTKWSGIGHENGIWGLNEFTTVQVVNVNRL